MRCRRCPPPWNGARLLVPKLAKMSNWPEVPVVEKVPFLNVELQRIADHVAAGLSHELHGNGHSPLNDAPKAAAEKVSHRIATVVAFICFCWLLPVQMSRRGALRRMKRVLLGPGRSPKGEMVFSPRRSR